MIANILRRAARAAMHFLTRKEMEPHRHEWQQQVIFIPSSNQAPTSHVIEWCPKCGKLSPQGKAWDLRREARRHYPGSIRLQRKWIKAWKQSPGASVPVSTLYDNPPYEPQPFDENSLNAQQYLRMRERDQR